MKQTPGTSKDAADKLVRGIKRRTRKHYSAEEKIRIVLAGLRGEESISALCRREGIAESLYYGWSKEFLEAGKQRLAGDTARQATAPEVKDLRAEAAALKEVVADLTLENRLLKNPEQYLLRLVRPLGRGRPRCAGGSVPSTEVGLEPHPRRDPR